MSCEIEQIVDLIEFITTKHEAMRHNDSRLIETIEDNVETLLNRNKQSLSPQKKAHLINMIFEHCKNKAGNKYGK